MTDETILPPITAGRVRGIARIWLRADAMRARADMEALAQWLDSYQQFLKSALQDAEHHVPAEWPPRDEFGEPLDIVREDEMERCGYCGAEKYVLQQCPCREGLSPVGD